MFSSEGPFVVITVILEARIGRKVVTELNGESVGKGKATPTRREREAANKRPLVAKREKLTKEQKRNKAQDRLRVREAMDAGDERYLPARDKGPQRRLVRDIVDSRYTVGEFMVPLMFGIIIVTFLPSYANSPSMQLNVLVTLYLYFAVSVADAVLIGRKVIRMLGEKFGKDQVERGVRWYAATRAYQFRPLRVPKPKVARGEIKKLRK